MSNIIVRKMRIQDAGKLAELTRQLTNNIVPGLERRVEGFVCLNNLQWFVAEKDGQVVGSAGLEIVQIPSKGPMGWLGEGPEGWIEEVVVDENHRRQGIGDFLVDKVLEYAQFLGLSQVKLTTGNGGAKVLYERHDFVEKQEVLMVKKYY